MSKNEELGIADRVASGFASFLDSRQTKETLLQEQVPHPFDSHPPLRSRIAKQDVTIDPEALIDQLSPQPEESWYDSIDKAEAFEKRLWDAYEARFQDQHDLLIALRLRPTNEEESEHVKRHFPDVEHFDKKGEVVVIASWWGLAITGEKDINFDDVDNMEKQDGMLYGQNLVVHIRDGKSRKISLGPNYEPFLEGLNVLWQRHNIALAESEAAIDGDTSLDET